MAKALARTYNCSTEFTLDVLGGKWKTVILSYLKERHCSYAELRRLVPRLSDKMLTERLHDLRDAGLIAVGKELRRKNSSVYMLTPRGRSLSSALSELHAWGEAHAPSFGISVGEPLRKLERA